MILTEIWQAIWMIPPSSVLRHVIVTLKPDSIDSIILRPAVDVILSGLQDDIVANDVQTPVLQLRHLDRWVTLGLDVGFHGSLAAHVNNKASLN